MVIMMLRTCIYATQMAHANRDNEEMFNKYKELVDLFNDGNHFHIDDPLKCYSILNES